MKRESPAARPRAAGGTRETTQAAAAAGERRVTTSYSHDASSTLCASDQQKSRIVVQYGGVHHTHTEMSSRLSLWYTVLLYRERYGVTRRAYVQIRTVRSGRLAAWLKVERGRKQKSRKAETQKRPRRERRAPPDKDI